MADLHCTPGAWIGTVIFERFEDGMVVFKNPPWPKHIGISDAFLAHADPRWVTHGDGMVRITPDFGGSALYGIADCVWTREVPHMNHYDLIEEAG